MSLRNILRTKKELSKLENALANENYNLIGDITKNLKEYSIVLLFEMYNDMRKQSNVSSAREALNKIEFGEVESLFKLEDDIRVVYDDALRARKKYMEIKDRIPGNAYDIMKDHYGNILHQIGERALNQFKDMLNTVIEYNNSKF